ncbi:hypothetical protein PSO31014_02879 [Pandoraea soli]|uniref:Uncharacterized protein n=1 Tax=Pandoraea soli TaxID=2508293 RepID=A0ABY6W386_9BURK|nr:hypothetical protein PSO31014_02879 [Pandoraea soli]
MLARRDWSGGVSYERPSGLEKIRQAVCERRLGLAHRPCDGFIAGEDGHRHGGHGAQTVRVTQQLQGQMRGGAIGIASQGMSCFASSRLPRLAPDGLPSHPRSARLTPTARLPASGLPASLACGLRIAAVVAMSSRPPPDSITLLAAVARGRGLLTVAGDELKKDGGNWANRALRANRTEQSQRLGSEPRNPVCGLNSKPFSSRERPCLHPVLLAVPRYCVATPRCPKTRFTAWPRPHSTTW